jgi:hypothetical protein
MNNKKVKVQKPAVAKALLKNKKPSKSKTKTKTKHKTLPKIKLNIIVPNEKIQYINVNNRKPRGPDKKPRIRGPNKKLISKSDDESDDKNNDIDI